MTQENRALTDERERMGGEMARLAERRSAAETELNDHHHQAVGGVPADRERGPEPSAWSLRSVTELRRQVAEVRGKIRALGNVNVGAIEEYKEVKERYDFMQGPGHRRGEEPGAELHRMITELCGEMRETVLRQLQEDQHPFRRRSSGNCSAAAAPGSTCPTSTTCWRAASRSRSRPRARSSRTCRPSRAASRHWWPSPSTSPSWRSIPSPFCILDEIEAALDDVNVVRYAQYLRRMTETHPVHRHHPPPRHHGGRRRPLRRHHAGGRRLQDPAPGPRTT